MKYKLSIVSLAVIFIASASALLATVGGPTFINDFRYNPADESVYYTRNDFSGRGCPPELIVISLNTGDSRIAYSCEQGEELVNETPYDHDVHAVSQEINKVTQDFKYLSRINLKKEGIYIEIETHREVPFPKEYQLPGNQHVEFLVSVFQNDKKATEFLIRGCRTDQPFMFDGYAIPGFEQKIALLLSAKGDCFEGGYTNESLHIVGGVDNLQKVGVSGYKSGNSALTPSEGTIVAYADIQNEAGEGVEPALENTENDTAPVDGMTHLKLVLVALAGFLFGVVLGVKASPVK